MNLFLGSCQRRKYALVDLLNLILDSVSVNPKSAWLGQPKVGLTRNASIFGRIRAIQHTRFKSELVFSKALAIFAQKMCDTGEPHTISERKYDMGLESELMTTTEVAELWEISMRRVQILCDTGKVKGAIRMGRTWIIPKGTPKPIDGRTKAAKQQILRKDEGNK